MSNEQADFTLHAWVDESIHLDAGFYLIAAAIADPTDCDQHRDTARGLVRRVGGRLHWHHELPKAKARIAEAFGQLDLAHTIVVASPIDPRRQERARRKCLERLLPELEHTGITQAWFETRTARLNRQDLKMVDAMRSSGTLTGALRVDFANPNVEPMLWIPDVIAGAVGAARRGDPSYKSSLRAPIDELDVYL
ncbi:hypothetical protein [Nocardioides panzhihuensis]|uniref:DUF3800 domain-containing protein n=1 Tax=Nocardioides panzhihuensis TaxID=860243 RepID=A0A7Z0DTQ6_9ACTN|nr:hypothetical protein [Nocardioides panzhihuensis]NYI81204.1 hypothetical protein [Nocardioides panzhihuensis]